MERGKMGKKKGEIELKSGDHVSILFKKFNNRGFSRKKIISKNCIYIKYMLLLFFLGV